MLRLPGPLGRGQDHHHQAAHPPAGEGLRPHHAVRARHRARHEQRLRAHRHPLGHERPLRAHDHRGEPALLREGARRDGKQHPHAARSHEPGRRPQDPRQELLEGHAPARRAHGGARARPRAAVPRRAHERPRPRRARRGAQDAARAQRPRHHRVPHHARYASRSTRWSPIWKKCSWSSREGSFRWKPRCARPGRCSARTSRTW